MEELKCKSCGSNDLKIQGGVWICQNCGNKYIVSHDEGFEQVGINDLIDEMIGYLAAADYKNAELLSIRILKKDSYSAYAHLVKGACCLATKANAMPLVSDEILHEFELAVKYANEEEKEDICKFVSTHVKKNRELLKVSFDYSEELMTMRLDKLMLDY